MVYYWVSTWRLPQQKNIYDQRFYPIYFKYSSEFFVFGYTFGINFNKNHNISVGYLNMAKKAITGAKIGLFSPAKNKPTCARVAAMTSVANNKNKQYTFNAKVDFTLLLA